MISLNGTFRNRPFSARRGFTLIELLVAITIMLIIFSMTAGIVALAINTDRIPSSARTVQAAILGARDRALRAGRDALDQQPKRGVRFVLNPNLPNTVNSLVYVGSQEDWTQGLVTVVNGNTNIVPESMPPNNASWVTLTNNGVNLVGARIKILEGTGTWYRLSAGAATSGTLTRGYVGTNGTYNYRLQLPAAILPNEQPLTIDGSVVIDLARSEFPSDWGTVGSFDQSKMEVLYTPNGNVSGPLSAQKPIILYLCTTDDVLNNRGPADPASGDKLAIKITPQTGLVQTFPINPDPVNPFKFAKQ